MIWVVVIVGAQGLGFMGLGVTGVSAASCVGCLVLMLCP